MYEPQLKVTLKIFFKRPMLRGHLNSGLSKQTEQTEDESVDGLWWKPIVVVYSPWW